jgi:DNA-binding NarL/FixJ family response regulator
MAISCKIRVLCVDDHPLVRDGIAFALQQQSDMELVAQAKNVIDAIAAFRQHRPDVTLMDLQMLQMNGIDAMAAIRSEFPNARIVILTTYSGDIQASRALKLGAVGYLLKGMLRTELIDTIRSVHAGHRRIPPEIASEIAEHYSADALSDREIEVLRVVASGCSNKIVAEEHIVARLTDGQFTGELDLLDNRETLVSCRAVQPTRLMRICRASLAQIMRSETEIANLIMQAFISRRGNLVQQATSGVTLLGHGYSIDTIRLQRFLSRNGY